MDHRSKLAGKVRAMLLDPNRAVSLQTIANETGVGHAWLSRFKSPYGENECPAADKLERVYEYLTGKVLEF